MVANRLGRGRAWSPTNAGPTGNLVTLLLTNLAELGHSATDQPRRADRIERVDRRVSLAGRAVPETLIESIDARRYFRHVSHA